ncbi:putative Disease resistance protein [Melia azedarach]|uniref:Disease resistance protein n=1 Tax=Melia azedarach TaxID=155640 RepID=A0ACC1Y3N8_MELAZ|nr:putative Disease resistance protein [Melia azedarach]
MSIQKVSSSLVFSSFSRWKYDVFLSFRAFTKHEETFRENIEKVKKWREALKEAANISGHELKDRSESEFIKDIVTEISNKLIHLEFKIHKELVGMNSRLEKLKLLFDTKSDDVRMIGICGMGGLGKTTIATVLYDLISSEFEGSSFLADVREISEKCGLITLQKQLILELLKLTESSICNVHDGINLIGSRLQRRKVLLIIDDVDKIEQLENLAASHVWFGPGSRIVITSRDKRLLIAHGVDEVYDLEVLSNDEALQLFCIKAFKVHHPTKEYEQLSKCIIEYAAGLPLALKVLGSFLYGRTIEEWKSALQRLKRDLPNEITEILQISFDGLAKIEKKIFLDIACFFKGKDKDYVVKILEGCNFDPIIGIAILIEKSLISISDHNKIWMHYLLQEMGIQIVKRESEEPEKRSRLWEETDIRHVLSENIGTELIEAIYATSKTFEEREHMMDPSDLEFTDLKARAFSKMTRLRLLKIHSVKLPEGLEYLPNELRLLEWRGYPLKSLPSNFNPYKIVELHMCWSSIEQIWIGIKHLNNLKSLTLSHSWNLVRTPNFTGVPNLEKLDLEDCKTLREIHPSLLVHKRLIELNLKHCTSLTSLPSSINMVSLRKLALSGCSKLRKFPEIGGHMKCLLELLLDGTDIKELPMSFELLPELVLLSLKDCKKLKSLPSAIINGLKFLETLDLSGCSGLQNVPENLGEIESLEELDISGTAIRQPPSSVFLLKNLKKLSLSGCKGTPASTSWFSWMARKSLDPMGLVIPSLSGLSSLVKLNLSNCDLDEGAIPISICNLLSLQELNLSNNNFVSLPEIKCLSKLVSLDLIDCRRLKSLPQLPSRVGFVQLKGCASLERVSDVSDIPDALKPYISNNYIEVYSGKCIESFVNNELYEAAPTPKAFLHNIVPGSKIPKWFRYQNEGSSVKIITPVDSYYNKNNLVGYAFSCVFHVDEDIPVVTGSISYHTLQLDFRTKDDKTEASNYLICRNNFRRVVSDNVWLLYCSNQQLHQKGLNFESNHAELSFRSTPESDPGLEVKRCGVHPIYFNEVEEFNSTTKGWRQSGVWNLNEFDQISIASIMDISRMSMQTPTDYAGEATASDEERFH